MVTLLMSTGAVKAGATRPSTYPANAYDDDGVDVTLIREMLARTPQERLEALRGFAKGLVELANAARPT